MCYSCGLSASIMEIIYKCNNLHAYTFTGGGVDYGSGPYEVTFTAGTTEASFNVSLTDDYVFESNENFMITIDPSSLLNNVTVGDRKRVTIIIMDNDGNYFVLSVYMHELLKLFYINFYIQGEHTSVIITCDQTNFLNGLYKMY